MALREGETFLAEIRVHDSYLVFESFHTKPFNNEIYPEGDGRMGVVVLNPKKNIVVRGEAKELLAKIVEQMPKSGDAIGDLSMWKAGDQWCFAWFGSNLRAMKLEDVLKYSRPARDTFDLDQFTYTE